MIATPHRHIMLFEPRLRGHHLSWLQYITEDFLQAGFQVTLAVDTRPAALSKIQDQLKGLKCAVQTAPLMDQKGRFRGGGKLRALAACMAEKQADEVFLNNFDEVASSCFRRAVMGWRPPHSLRGRINGVYFRPRFLFPGRMTLRNRFKRMGFKRLTAEKWFKRLYLLDEYLYAELVKIGLYHFLPDPWTGQFNMSKTHARQQLRISPNATVFLHYGIGDRRKGLHLVIEAMLRGTRNEKWLLLCAGELDKDRKIRKGLERLRDRGQAKILNRYVSKADEKLCFCACDVVLLPYIRHMGSSGVLSLAAAAGKMVIASNEGLLGTRVPAHQLGMVFDSGNVSALSEKMLDAVKMSPAQMEPFRQSALKYARICSREAFGKALLKPFMKS